MRKKLFTLFAVICCAIFFTAHAEVYSGTCGENLTWSLNTEEGILTIDGTGAMINYESYSNQSSTSPWFIHRSTIDTVIISNGCTSIGDYAFKSCNRMTSITIPNSVTTIGKYAFDGCSGLKAISIPNRVTSIGSSAFRDCPIRDVYISDLTAWCKIEFADLASNPLGAKYGLGILYLNGELLTDIEIPESMTSIGDYIFMNCSYITSVSIPNSVTTIGSHAFYNCHGLRSVTIPNSVISIGSSAFAYCSSLTSVTIPNSVTSIGWSAFSKCSGMTYISIGSGVSSIGSRAFSDCRGLTSITIGNGVTTIGDYVFSGCSGLTSIIIPDNVVSLGSYLFSGCENLIAVTIGSGVVEIGDYHSPIYTIFAGCRNLSSITVVEGNANYDSRDNCNAIIETSSNTLVAACLNTIIPNSVTTIGKGAFYCCSWLETITIPESVISIGEEAFRGCDSLKNINMGKNVNRIERFAFSGCNSLTSLVLTSDVSYIKENAFLSCSNLKTIVMLDSTPPSIESNTFTNIHSNAVVYVPNESIEKYQSKEYWKNMTIMPIYAISQSEAATSTSVQFINNAWIALDKYIASVGIEGNEQQPGNVLEYIGLEPNSEYKDIPIVLTANTGETDTMNVSFSTTALELTTKASKPVSSTTAILLAETNMSDAEINCGFEYKRNDAPADMAGTKVFCPVASGQMAGRLKNLKDDVYYKYRAFYQSAAGNMYYGDWQYIFTGDVAVEFDPILYTYGATVVKENEATISGYALAGSEDFTEQGFEYWAESRADNSANAPYHRMSAELNEHFFAQASGIKMTVTLTNLDEGTVYKYRAYGKVGNQYYYGSEQTFTTQGEWQEGQGVDNVQGYNVQSTKVQKILRDGQIYIMYNGTMYNVQGQKVK